MSFANTIITGLLLAASFMIMFHDELFFAETDWRKYK
jgi:hypothetical protein